MKYSVFILSHQDDEIGVFEIIRQALKNRENIYIFYMTNGAIKKEIPRNELYTETKKAYQY